MATEITEWSARWVADRDWTKAKTITGGVDIGSMSAQALIMTDDEIFAYSNIRTGADSAATALRAMDRVLEGTGMSLDNIQYIVE